MQFIDIDLGQCRSGDIAEVTLSAGANVRLMNSSDFNFAKALTQMPTASPSALRDRQGAPYTWAILMDDRIRAGEW